jgi:hypothetical protein
MRFLQCGTATGYEYQHGEHLIWGPLLSPSMGHPLLEDFEKSAQEPTVHLNIQPATQTTRFSDFQSNEANSSNQSILAPSDFPTFFSHKKTPST